MRAPPHLPLYLALPLHSLPLRRLITDHKYQCDAAFPGEVWKLRPDDTDINHYRMMEEMEQAMMTCHLPLWTQWAVMAQLSRAVTDPCMVENLSNLPD